MEQDNHNLEDKMTAMMVVLARIESDLKHHIKRTALLEDEVRSWKQILLPIQAHVTLVQSVGRVILGLAAIAATIAAFLALK